MRRQHYLISGQIRLTDGQAALPGDIAALLLFEIHTLGMSGTISICVPHPVIEPLMDRLNTQAWFSSSSELTAAMALIQTVVITAIMVVFGLLTRRLAQHGASAQ